MQTAKWAMGEAHTPTISGQIQQISPAGAEKSAEDRADSFAAAVAAVMSLPLSPAEKAEAVRRLLAGREGGKP